MIKIAKAMERLSDEDQRAVAGHVWDSYGKQIPWWYTRRRAAQHVPSKDLRQIVMERDGAKCRACGSPDRLQLDHIYPLSEGGPTVLENLQVLCMDCNLRKGTTRPATAE